MFDSSSRLSVSNERHSDNIWRVWLREDSTVTGTYMGGSSFFIKYWWVTDVCPIRILLIEVSIFLVKSNNCHLRCEGLVNVRESHGPMRILSLLVRLISTRSLVSHCILCDRKNFDLALTEKRKLTAENRKFEKSDKSGNSPPRTSVTERPILILKTYFEFSSFSFLSFSFSIFDLLCGSYVVSYDRMKFLVKKITMAPGKRNCDFV